MDAQAILLTCALITLAIVCVAGFLGLIAGVIIYQYSQTLKQQVALAPAKLERAIVEAVAEFVKPYREIRDQDLDRVEPVGPDGVLFDEEDYA